MEFKVLDIGYSMPERPKIMIVDDDPTIHSLISDTIGEDYRILSAFNGRESIQKIEQAQPVLILMDVMMPDLGGYEAVRLLQGNKLTKDIPVLMVSAIDFDPSTTDMLKQEPNVMGFITKPFRPKQLREIVKTFIPKKD